MTATTPRRRRRTTTRKPPAEKVIIPDTHERQAAAALANLQAAEAKRLAVTKVESTPTRRTAAKAKADATINGQAKAVPVVDFDVDAALDKLNLDYIQCRDFGHMWTPFTARWMANENAYESQLRCARCKTVRTRWLSRTGEQRAKSYDYPDGYSVSGLGRLSGSDRDKIRLRSILAVIDK